ncbi:glycosyltransferase [Clostridium perfringens]|nr:glycosyltransferase [Clostridium perfringens]MDM0922921.1 glycosyltransferase [Clostridium perfringens]
MKKVGLLISTLNSGGAERVVSRLSNLLKDEYKIYIIIFEDTYICYEYSGQLINLNTKSKDNFINKIYNFAKRIIKMKNIKKKLDLDVVISFLETPNIVNILSKNKKCKTLVSIRNYSEAEKKVSMINRVTNYIIGNLYHKADGIIPVSKVIKESLVNDYKLDEKKISVIYNPYNVNEINELAKEEIKDEHKEFMNSNKIFISVGRHMYQKGFWHLIKAFKLVHDEDKETKLIIVGKDYQNGAVKKLVYELELNESVLLVGYHDNPFKFIRNSNIYILSSMFEGFPNSMVEALACGCPVIAADCKSGPREILDKYGDINKVSNELELVDYGILIPALNEEENWDKYIIDESDKVLANAMKKLINDKILMNNYSIKAKERAKDFNFNRCKAEYVELIESLL